MAKKRKLTEEERLKRAARTAYISSVALDYLAAWVKNPLEPSEPYMKGLPDEKARDQFKQSVGMGKLLRTVLMIQEADKGYPTKPKEKK